MSRAYKKLSCPSCGKKAERQTINKNKLPKCPGCGASLTIPKTWCAEATKCLFDSKSGAFKDAKAEGFDTKDEAQEWIKAQEERRKAGKSLNKKKSTFPQICNAYLDWKEETTWGKEDHIKKGILRTVDADRLCINSHLIPFFAYHFKSKDKAIRDLPGDIAHLYRDWRKSQLYKGKPIKPSTVQKEMADLRKIIRWAHQKRLITCTLDAVKFGKKKGKTQYLKPSEIQQLMDYLIEASETSREAETALMIVVIALNTGLRLEQIITLRWEDIHLYDASRPPYIEMYAKHGTQPFIPLTERSPLPGVPGLLPVLRALKEERFGGATPTGPIVCHRINGRRSKGEGYARSHGGGSISRQMRLAGLPEGYSLHTLRHTLTTHMNRYFPGNRGISVILGHTFDGDENGGRQQARMTSQYSHEDKLAAFDVMAMFSQLPVLTDNSHLTIAGITYHTASTAAPVQGL